MTLPVALIDTDTLSEVMKGRDVHVQQKAQQYLSLHNRFCFSIITRYEILRGLKEALETGKELYHATG